MDSKKKDDIIKNIVQDERLLDKDVFSRWYDSFDNDSATAEELKDFDEAKREAIKQEMFHAIQAVQEEKKSTAAFFVRSSWRSVAAALVFVFFVGAVVYHYKNNRNSYVYQSAYGEIKNVLLKDGSHVVLNGNSTLRFVDRADKREAWLVGEASFQVVHKANDQRFVIHLSDTTSIEVLGTEFNVLNRSAQSRVALRSGKVKVAHRAEREYADETYMSPGDLLTFNKSKKGYSLQHANDVDRYFSWQKEQFFLDETSLADMLVMLRETYGISLKVNDDSLYNRKASGSFPLRKDKKRLLKNMTELYDLVLVEESGTFVLKDQ